MGGGSPSQRANNATHSAINDDDEELDFVGSVRPSAASDLNRSKPALRILLLDFLNILINLKKQP